ncbi:MAG TPA: cation diffusion facilitator family transporter [Jatrophihabitantaceae bacterium]|jgi:cation diffusion facilitator family transporter
MAEDEQNNGGGERTLTVLLALAANLVVGILKLAAGLISGSGALLSEAAHSAGDSTTEVLLLVAQRRSGRPADRRHPFGYGKERYFWSLLAAGAIFMSGAAFSIYQGLHTILGGSGESKDLWINYIVLALAAVCEGISFLQAMRQVRSQARRRHGSMRAAVVETDDPTINSVAMEDSTALVGIVVAALGVLLHQLTGDAVYDGVASLIIGGLLLLVAFILARTCGDLLIGKQADLELLEEVEKFLEDEDEIVDIVDVLSMLTGTGRVLLCVRADFVDEFTVGEVEQACMRIDGDLREHFPVLDEIFIQPVSRDDPRIQERVRARYGRVLSDE